MVQGVNTAGLLVATGGSDAVAAVLSGAASVAEALALLEGPNPVVRTREELLLADSRRCVVAGGPGRLPLAEPSPLAPIRGDLEEAGRLISQVRRADRGEAPTASALVALLPAKAPATVLVCLGPPRWGVFMRVWPGLPLGPDGGAGEPHRCPLSILAARLAASGGEERAITIRGQLDEVEAEVLAEAADADRLAALMDAAGDDSGARVRRMLAEAYAIDRITAALEQLLRGAGPSL
ncbi:MAG: hypothetical protein E6J14_12875 [Chloroflexi bacterium]|nr:MAG: hypothetical protein E6J14_12875 [Chloroflexota bacterium]